jgi:hypothetical protein
VGVTAATLNGNRVTDARLAIPAWGASYADVTVDGSVQLSGAVTLVVADLTVQCTVLSGGPAGDASRSYFRVVAGAGGWGKSIPKRSYANDAGVKLTTVLGDAAGEVGETIDTTTVDPTARLGPYWTRPAGPACRLLEVFSPNAWYIGEDGKTRLGARPATKLAAQAARTSELDLARGTLTLASPTISGILPGLVVDGLTVVDVEHTFDAKDGLRSKVWGKQAGGTSRRLAAFRALFDQLDPDRMFRGVYEYRIVTQEGERLNLQAVRVSTGMPDLKRAVVRPGVPGCKASHFLGSRVLVGFVDADPSRPVVLAFEDAEGPGFVPPSLGLAGGGAAVGRVGDSVQVTLNSTEVGSIIAPGGSGGACTLPGGSLTLTGQITAGSSKVTSG